jgi:hypothetical protein
VTSCSTVNHKRKKQLHSGIKRQQIEKSKIQTTPGNEVEIIRESPVEIKEYYEPPSEDNGLENSADNNNLMNAEEIPLLTTNIKEALPKKESTDTSSLQQHPQKRISAKIPDSRKQTTHQAKDIIAVSETGGINFAISENSVINSQQNIQSNKSDLIFKKAKTLYILENYDEGLKLLEDNWSKFSNSKKKNKSNFLASATLLKGKLYFKKAQKTRDVSTAKGIYQKAIKSFYEVLSRYNARRCPSAPEAIKLFRKSKKQYEKTYKTSIGFPPEF